MSDWVGKLKGASSHYINNRIANRKVLQWQSGYGIVSFGQKDLDWVVRYIEEQRKRHAGGRTSDRLEAMGDD